MNDDLLAKRKRLSAEIRKHNKLYQKGIPLIRDDYYDSLCRELKELENTLGQALNSPLTSIHNSQRGNKVDHSEPMLSLDHGFGVKAIQAFLKRITNNGIEVFPLVIEHKVDGVSLALRYANGELKQAITRGNGKYGIDVTKQIQSLEVPRSVDHMHDFEVRGEMYVTFDEFERVKDSFSSPRNLCAAIVHSKNPVNNVRLRFAIHSCIGINVNTYTGRIDYVARLGFETIQRAIANDPDECVMTFEKIELERPTIKYPIDGVVLKLNNIRDWEELGTHRTAPRYAFAVKFTPISQTTTIREIKLQVGKSGTITPVAIFDPIQIDGHNISRASLHNIDELYQSKYGVGDIVSISRSGDTIPYLSEKIFHAGNDPVVTNCPSCNSVLEKFEKTLRCLKLWECQAQKVARIDHFCARNAFNIDGLGEESIKDMVQNNFIYYPIDIFDLPEKIKSGELDLAQLPGWNTKSVNNLIRNIELSKVVKLANFLFAAGIPNVGYGNAQTLASNFSGFDELFQYFRDNTEPIVNGLGKITCKSIKSFLEDEREAWILRRSRISVV